jgi:hypothetical protein
MMEAAWRATERRDAKPDWMQPFADLDSDTISTRARRYAASPERPSLTVSPPSPIVPAQSSFSPLDGS